MSPSEHNSIVGATAKVATTVAKSLAPQFLALLLINAVFMAAFVWYLDARATHTMAVVTQLMDSCLKR